MRVLRDPLGDDDPATGSVLSIGNFDGVHRGHQAVLRHVVERASDLECPAAVMTFDPHPVKLLRPSHAPKLLSTLEQRIERIVATGVNEVLVVPFTHRLARMEADRFVREVLVGRLEIREVYIGNNFRFGADRGGDVNLLVGMGRRLGFDAASAPTVVVDGEPVSSSRVRAAVARGDVAGAATLLGRPHFLDGVVIEGRRLGRQLGFPTLNLEPDNELMPGFGVYVTAVWIPSFRRLFHAVTNVGVRPTIYDDSATTVESHVLDFSADVYGEPIRLFLLDRLRDERSFPSAVDLMAQIRRDVDAAREWFATTRISALETLCP